MVKPYRLHCSFLLPAVALFAVACGDATDPNSADGKAGANGASGAATVATAGSGTAGVPAGTGGAGGGSTGEPTVPLAGSGQALGGGDQGALFGKDMTVPIMPPQMGGAGGGGPVIPGDGHVVTSMIRGSINGTAVFTQKGEDVTVVVNLTSGCADGNHQFHLHDGYSCDNAMTEGKIWGARGSGIGADSGIPCSGGKGTLTHTRSGSDKSKNWTVGDQNLDSDVTTHVVIVSDEKDPASRASCGNFF